MGVHQQSYHLIACVFWMRVAAASPASRSEVNAAWPHDQVQPFPTSDAEQRDVAVREGSSWKPRSAGLLRGSRCHNTSAATAASGGQGNLADKPFFMHIPKNAGSAIETAGKQVKLWWGRAKFAELGMIQMKDGTFCASHHVPPRLLPARGRQKYQGRRVFCVVRHPYERAISEYTYLLSAPWGDLNPGKLDEVPCTVEGLNDFLQHVLVKVLLGHKFVNDCHMLPQVSYLADGHDIGCHDVLRFEHMPDAFTSYMAHHHVHLRPGALERENESRNRCPELGTHSLHNRTMELLDMVYSEDFDKFGYHRGYQTIN